jgi:predicted enzyme related to lactoylglutathione lyase
MSNKEKPEIGSITWSDLTVPNAEEVKDFYSIVVDGNQFQHLWETIVLLI